jgi:hypothetical protein
MPQRPKSSPQTLSVLEAFLERPSQWRYGYDLAQETGLSGARITRP